MQNILTSQPWRRLSLALVGTAAILMPLGEAAWAGDPFRTENPHDISDTAEQMFYAMFRDGDYVTAQTYLEDIGSNEDPMVHAMAATLNYLDGDWDDMLAQAKLTQESAAAIANSDALRSNLYSAVGIFMEGAYILQAEGVAQGTPKALGMLQQVFDYMDAAEDIDSTDPELSVLKGFMDLLLAVNLPFANPEQAVAKLENYGHPTYVSYRGIAIGYRDLNNNEAALDAVETALAAAPENPDLLYLKAQVLKRLGQVDASVESFGQALEYADQLPSPMVRQIAREQCRAEGLPGAECRTRVDEEYGS
ncbi:MAG: Sll0314/Alr1548 family TPR repeat-containing protein [Cyanobacteria bacterium J06638_28]